MLVELPDAEALAAVFERAIAVLEAEGLLLPIPAIEESAATKQSTAAAPLPAAPTSSSPRTHWIASTRVVLLIGGAFTVTACGLLAIKTRLKEWCKPRNLFSHSQRRCLAVVPCMLLIRAPQRRKRLP